MSRKRNISKKEMRRWLNNSLHGLSRRMMKKGIKQADSRKMLVVFRDTITKALKSGEDVEIEYFGVFKVIQIPMHVEKIKGKNVFVKASQDIIFYPSKEFIYDINIH